LETISKCVEKSILRLPQFKKSLDDLRSRDYSKDGGARDDAILKSTISELHKLITEAPQFWSYELTIWAINTLANIGNILGPDRYTNHRSDSKSVLYTICLTDGRPLNTATCGIRMKWSSGRRIPL